MDGVDLRDIISRTVSEVLGQQRMLSDIILQNEQLRRENVALQEKLTRLMLGENDK